MKNEIDCKRNNSKTVIGNTIIWHKRKYKELKENSNSNTKYGITEKKFRTNHNLSSRFINPEIKSISYHTCYYSPVKPEFVAINDLNSCKLKEFTHPGKILENKNKINAFYSEYIQEQDFEHHNCKINSTRINNFKKKM